METEISGTDNPAMTFDEVSMERSKSFVKALQELKHLRPQLYSAADYCEKSYLHSEQKQMVLDNLKDYTVKALVNAVDHLGTVASKLTDLFDQQNSDISTMELRANCVSQQLLTCRTYIDKEGLRQQQLLAVIPLHHKHYILPNSVNKRVHFSPLRRTDTRQNHYQAISRLQPSDAPASKSLSWHLGSETKSTLKGTSTVAPSSKDSKDFTKTSGVFHLLSDEENMINKKPLAGSQVSGVPAASAVTKQTYGVAHKDLEVPKLLTAHKSLDNNPRREIIQAPINSLHSYNTCCQRNETIDRLRTIASGTIPDPGSLIGNDTTVLDVPVKVAYSIAVSLMKDIGSDWDIDYQLDIGLTFDIPVVGDITIPVSTQGEIKLPSLRDFF